MILFVLNNLISINNFIDRTLEFTDKIDKIYVYVTKITGATTGSVGLAKGSADLIEALACQDGICATVSAIGVTADTLQICTWP